MKGLHISEHGHNDYSFGAFTYIVSQQGQEPEQHTYTLTVSGGTTLNYTGEAFASQTIMYVMKMDGATVQPSSVQYRRGTSGSWTSVSSPLTGSFTVEVPAGSTTSNTSYVYYVQATYDGNTQTGSTTFVVNKPYTPSYSLSATGGTTLEYTGSVVQRTITYTMREDGAVVTPDISGIIGMTPVAAGVFSSREQITVADFTVFENAVSTHRGFLLAFIKTERAVGVATYGSRLIFFIPVTTGNLFACKKILVADLAVVENAISTGGFFDTVCIIKRAVMTRDISRLIFSIPCTACGLSAGKEGSVTRFTIVENAVSAGGFGDALGIVDGAVMTRDGSRLIFFIPGAAGRFGSGKEISVTGFTIIKFAISASGFFHTIGFIDHTMITGYITGLIFSIPCATCGFTACKERIITWFPIIKDTISAGGELDTTAVIDHTIIA